MINKLEPIRKKLFRYRLKKQYRRKFRIVFFSILGLILVSFLIGPISRWVSEMVTPKAYGRVKVDWYRDYNGEHLYYARRCGIHPFHSDKAFHEAIDEMVKNDKLVKISSNKYYAVNWLTHSHPYLTPEAKRLLDDIGKRFRDKLDEQGLGKYAYQISSLLRTQESQRRLRGSNGNATRNTSSHLYGTTFDVPYATVIKRPLPWVKVEVADARAIRLLSETIGELRREGRCVVVTEKYEKCFHITVAH
jgi:hypothetical protein